MFGLFKKKTEFDRLQEKYERLMKKWYQLSKVNRSESDAIYAEAEEVLNQMDALNS